MSSEVLVKEYPMCDFCAQVHKSTRAKYDGRTVMGPWAYMCPRHWREYGVGQLGTGFGQKLVTSGK